MGATMGIGTHWRQLNRTQRSTFVACFLGWTLDAFDFFLLTLCLGSIATEFHVNLPTVADAIVWTLAMRPVGAALFGAMAERFGRRPTLMLNVICFSVFELASAFAPGLRSFLVLRGLFGIAMGGEWGVGAALALETLPTEGRGFFSGLLQEGYVVGNLLAAALYWLLFPHLHGTGLFTPWRVLFMLGALPALLALYVRSQVPESPTWLSSRAHAGPISRSGAGVWARSIREYLPVFLLLVCIMMAFTAFSHGTQDLYPTFLEREKRVAPGTAGLIVVLGSLGALLGGITCGSLSERFGRKRTIIAASLLAIPMIPLWAYSHTTTLLATGGFLMQFMVQGAWGVVPAYLNELSPSAVRAIFPGLAYQLGNLLTSRNGKLQALLARRYPGGLRTVLAATVVIVALMLALLTALGAERKGSDLAADDATP